MPTIAGAAALYHQQRVFRAEYDKYMGEIVTTLQTLVRQYARRQVTDPDGNVIRVIPPEAGRQLLVRAGDIIQRFFVGADGRQPFGVDGVTPLAVYPALLNDALVRSQYAVLRSHSKFIRRRLINAPDVERWLRASRLSAEQWQPTNPLAQYEPAHTWVDPNGYTLSTRIWRTGVSTRARLDALLTEAIETGMSAERLAAELEQFLLPSRGGLRTQRPYGTNASFDAMRLARSEITRAHSQASSLAARANPYVTGMDYALSARHPKFDICDGFATIGMGGERLRDPYPIGSNYPIPVSSTHPQCLCTLRPFAGRGSREVVESFRQQLLRGDPPPITAVDAFALLLAALGRQLVQSVYGVRAPDEDE